MREGASSVVDELPWIAFPAIDILNKRINSSSKVFEYGGGGSTLYFLNHAGEVITVEHNEEWFRILSAKISSRKKDNSKWKGEFIPAEKGDLGPSPDASNPEHYSSTDEQSAGHNYKRYASDIDRFQDGYFDCVVVDGRSRPSCIMHALPKIKKGGCLVLDNSERDYYLTKMRERLAGSFETILDDFCPTPYSREFTRISIWIKK